MSFITKGHCSSKARQLPYVIFIVCLPRCSGGAEDIVGARSAASTSVRQAAGGLISRRQLLSLPVSCDARSTILSRQVPVADMVIIVSMTTGVSGKP
jgi:hypothetical protein